MYKYFDIVRNDKEIVEMYNKIKEYEDKSLGLAYHDYNHVCNVANVAEKLLKALNCSNKFIDEALVGVMLHDIGCIEGKEGHANRSYEYAKKYLEKNNISLENKDMVLEAIKNHSNGFDTDNIIQIVIILADKIDVKKNRITKFGCNAIGNRQYQYVNDINVNLDNKKFTVCFECDKNIDLKELEEYYFTKKIFMAIKSFAKRINVSADVYVNDKPWEEFYKC